MASRCARVGSGITATSEYMSSLSRFGTSATVIWLSTVPGGSIPCSLLSTARSRLSVLSFAFHEHVGTAVAYNLNGHTGSLVAVGNIDKFDTVGIFIYEGQCLELSHASYENKVGKATFKGAFHSFLCVGVVGINGSYSATGCSIGACQFK